MHIRSDSLEYAEAELIVDHDPTGATVEVALPVTGVDPEEAEWTAADVKSIEVTGTNQWTLTYRVLLGPSGDFELADGCYDWLVRMTDSPEILVRNVAQVWVV